MSPLERFVCLLAIFDVIHFVIAIICCIFVAASWHGHIRVELLFFQVVGFFDGTCKQLISGKHTNRRYIYYLPQCSNMAGSFTQVAYVGSYFYFYYTGLTSMNNMFNSLTSVGSYFYLFNNPYLQSVTNSFTSLQSVSSNL